MNLFILDEDPVISASLNCDIHVNKIILEAASCMCAAHWEYDFPMIQNAPLPLRLGKYRGRTHHNNHITKWVRASYENYRWTYKHAVELCRQHRVRAGHNHDHASKVIVDWLGENEPPLESFEMTPFRQAVAESCYHDNPVVAYWVYYVTCKSHLAFWRASEKPSWFVSLSQKHHEGSNAEDLLKYAEELYVESRTRVNHV